MFTFEVYSKLKHGFSDCLFAVDNLTHVEAIDAFHFTDIESIATGKYITCVVTFFGGCYSLKAYYNYLSDNTKCQAKIGEWTFREHDIYVNGMLISDKEYEEMKEIFGSNGAGQMQLQFDALQSKILTFNVFSLYDEFIRGKNERRLRSLENSKQS